LEIPRDIIVEEYLLSDGDVRMDFFNRALDGIGKPEIYFRKLNLMKIMSNLTNWFVKGT